MAGQMAAGWASATVSARGGRGANVALGRAGSMRRTDACAVRTGLAACTAARGARGPSRRDGAGDYKPASRCVVGHCESMPPGEVVGSIASGR